MMTAPGDAARAARRRRLAIASAVAILARRALDLADAWHDAAEGPPRGR